MRILDRIGDGIEAFFGYTGEGSDFGQMKDMGIYGAEYLFDLSLIYQVRIIHNINIEGFFSGIRDLLGNSKKSFQA